MCYDELRRIRNEVIVAYSEEIFLHFPEGPEVDHEKPAFRPSTYRLFGININHCTSKFDYSKVQIIMQSII